MKKNWLDWSLLTKHADVHRFATLLNERRLMRDLEPERRRMSLNHMLSLANKSWHGIKLNEPDLSSFSHSIALSVEQKTEKLKLYLIMNAYWEPLNFELPANGSNNLWRRWIDTSLDSPNDIVPWRLASAVVDATYQAAARSVVVLYSRTLT